MPAVLDTHAAIWYLLDSSKLPPAAFQLIDGLAASGTPAWISAITLIEVAYLAERGRIAANAFDVFIHELGRDRSAFSVIPVDAPIAAALRSIPRSLVADMPDRIIAATALHLGASIITRDRSLQSVGIKTIW